MSTTKHFTLNRFYPWLVIALCSSFLFYKYILQVSPSIMTDQLMREFEIHGTGLGNLAATFFYSFLVTQLFAGLLLDKYSPRLLTSLALALCAAGTYFFSQADSLVAAGIARTLMGVGAAFATVSYMKMTSIWFKPHQYAFVGGLLASAAMLGAIFGQAPLSLVMHAYGWRECLTFCAVLGIFLALLFFTLARDKPPVPISNIEHTHHEFSLKDVIDVLKSKQNWLLTLYSGLVFSPIDAFGGLWSIPFLRESYHLTYTHAALLVSFVFIGLGIGSPLLGLLSDRLGNRRKVMIVSAVISLIAISIVIYCPQLPLWLLATLLFIFGFATGAFMLGFALGREINKLAVAATIVALINTGDVIFGAVTEPLIGKILDLGWSGAIVNNIHYFAVSDYRLALSLIPLYIVLGIVMLLFIRERNPSTTTH